MDASSTLTSTPADRTNDGHTYCYTDVPGYRDQWGVMDSSLGGRPARNADGLKE